MIRIINQNYTKEVAKQVLRSAIVITKKLFNRTLYKHGTKLSTKYWNFKNEVTKPTDIFEDKRNIPVI